MRDGYSNDTRSPSVGLSVRVSHANIFKSRRDGPIFLWLLLIVDRKSDFLVQNLPSDLRPEVEFRLFRRFSKRATPSYRFALLWVL